MGRLKGDANQRRTGGVQYLASRAGALPPKLFGDAALLAKNVWGKASRLDQTAMQGLRARQRLVEQLQMAAANSQMTAPLVRCGTGLSSDDHAPCWHVLCPACSRLLGRWLAWTVPVAMRRTVRSRSSTGTPERLDHLSVLKITASERLTQGASRKQLDAVINGLHATLSFAGVSIAIGAINLRGMRDANGGFGLDLQVELRAVFLEAETMTAEFKRTVRSLNKRTARQPRRRPVQVKPLGAQPDELKHLVIAQPIVRRVEPGYLKANGKHGRAGHSKKRMSPDEMVEASDVFSNLGLAERVFVHGAKVTTNAKQRMVIRPTREALRERTNDPMARDDYFADLAVDSDA